MADKKLTNRQYLSALWHVSKRSFKIAPLAAVFQVFDSIIQAALPIATTYFAALTTTSLTQAYSGEAGAGDKAILYVVITAIFGVLSLAWSSVNSFVSQKTRYIIEAAIEDELKSKLGSLPFAMYDDKEVIDKFEKARRFSNFFSYTFSTIGSMFSSLVGAIGSIVALLIVNPWLSLVVLLAIIPKLVIQLRLARLQIKHWEGNITTRRRRYNIGWMLNEPRFFGEMRIYGVTKHLIKIHAKLRDTDEKERLDFELKTIWKKLFADIGEAVVELAALIWVTLQIINQSQPVGQFVYVQQLVSRALSQAGSLADQLGGIDEDLANMIDYQEFMDIETVEDTGRELDGDIDNISIRSVSFVYPKTEVRVLEDINFDIKRGEHIAIVGENGAGKSTLIKLIMGLYRPSAGQILVNGTDLKDLKQSSWHEQIALLSQDFVSYVFATIHENITLGDVAKSPTKTMVRHAIEQAEFGSVVDKLKYGDKTFIERWMALDDDDSTATELSGGQMQRLALARNFYRDSPIVILDEPTSAIDALAEARIFQRLFAQKTKTIIVISHRLTTIKKADRIYMMKDGRIVEVGTADELIDRQGEFYRMFESQIK